MQDCVLIDEHRSFGGLQQRFRHFSVATSCEMTFSVYTPAKADAGEKVPALLWLSGLTCTDENFVQKACAQRCASELGLMIIAPDTSPRGDKVPDDPDGAWDFGLGAGFYVNATQAPWSEHYQMFYYVNRELLQILEKNFPWNGKISVSGHSMGGHGALISALKLPDQYCSVSAFSPIVNPSQTPWGQKAFTHYLGDKREDWVEYDSCELVKSKGLKIPCFIDQGSDDDFLEKELKTENLLAVIKGGSDQIKINFRKGYDHSYFFIASFIDEHLRFHYEHLRDEQ